MPRRRRVANGFTSALLSAVGPDRVRDSQCGMRLLRGRALAVEFPDGGYESETIHLKRCLRAGVRIAWVPVRAIYRGEASSFRPVRDSLRILRACFSYAGDSFCALATANDYRDPCGASRCTSRRPNSSTSGASAAAAATIASTSPIQAGHNVVLASSPT